jgi:hypothetical protein
VNGTDNRERAGIEMAIDAANYSGDSLAGAPDLAWVVRHGRDASQEVNDRFSDTRHLRADQRAG